VRVGQFSKQNYRSGRSISGLPRTAFLLVHQSADFKNRSYSGISYWGNFPPIFFVHVVHSIAAVRSRVSSWAVGSRLSTSVRKLIWVSDKFNWTESPLLSTGIISGLRLFIFSKQELQTFQNVYRCSKSLTQSGLATHERQCVFAEPDWCERSERWSMPPIERLNIFLCELYPEFHSWSPLCGPFPWSHS